MIERGNDVQAAPVPLDDLEWDALPQGLNELRDVIGPAGAVALAQRRGGQALYVPRRFKPDHWLAGLIGEAELGRFVEAYGGDRVSVPKIDAVLRQLRERELKAERGRGASIAVLAARFGLTRRRILQILAA